MRNVRRQWLFLCLLFLLPFLSAYAGRADSGDMEAKKEKARNILKLEKMDLLYEDSFSTFRARYWELIDKRLQRIKEKYNNNGMMEAVAPVIAKYADASLAYMASVINADSLMEHMVEQYAEKMDERTMDALLRFYASPEGRSALAVQYEIAKDSIRYEHELVAGASEKMELFWQKADAEMKMEIENAIAQKKHTIQS